MALYFTGIALALGMAAQAIALRFKLPGIVLLLAAGVLVGPDVLGVIDPAVFHESRTELVGLAVAIILFEGGLGLQLETLRAQQRSLALLLTLGGAISFVGGTLAARYLLDMPWSTASLYGSLMIVTGPTVVTPLLARITVDRSVRDMLVGEGVLIDPIGAIVAIVAAEYLVQQHGALASGWLVIWQLTAGGAFGALGGIAMATVLRRHWVHEDLWNPAVLASVVLFAALSVEYIGGEAGLMTAVAMGVWLGNTGLRELGRLRQFNEEVTVLLLSFLFILLAADLPLAAIADLGWGAVGVVAVLIWVARPASVFLCTLGSELSYAQRAFVAWVCPRGIVAASVAGLFGTLLTDAGQPGGKQLEALVFVTVALTVAIQGLTIGPVAHLLRVDLPSLRGTIIVGADYFGRMLARLLIAFDRQVILIDRNRFLTNRAMKEGLPAFAGDALSVDDLENAGVRYVDAVLAATTNPSLNTLISQRVKENFRLHRVLVIDELENRRADKAHPFPGAFPGLYNCNRKLADGSVVIRDYRVGEGSEAAGRRLAGLDYGDGEFALMLHRRDRVFLASADQCLEVGDQLLCAAPAGSGTTPLEGLTLAREVGATEIEALAEGVEEGQPGN